VWSGHSCPLPLTLVLHLVLGGAVVHRCGNSSILNRALQVAEKLGFVSGHRFSNAVSSSNSDAPSGPGTESRLFSKLFSRRGTTIFKLADNPPSGHTPEHDTQKCGAAGPGRDGPDYGILSPDLRLHHPECSARSGSSGRALLLVHLRICVSHRSRVLFRFPQSAVMIEEREVMSRCGEVVW